MYQHRVLPIMFPKYFIWLLPCVFAAKWSEFPSLSSTPKTLQSLTSRTLVSFLKSSNLSLIWYHPKNISSSDRLTFSLLKNSFLLPVAERMQIPIAEFITSNASTPATRLLGVRETEVDTIHVYSNLRRIVYHGLRTPDALTSFIKKLQCPKFTVIEGKSDKKLFDLVDQIRVLAFVVPGSPFARAYANASLAFGPSVKFFVVLDPLVARRYALTEGSIQLHRPGERSFAELVTATSSHDIISFVRDEAGKSSFRTRRLSSENIHSFWSEDYDQPKFVLLTSYSHSPKAAHFHKLLRRSVKNDTNCQVSVIDVDLFPGMAEYWKKYFGVDPSARPLLGYVALHNETALWMDQKQVNSTDGKESEMQNQLTVSDFITSILNGSVTLKTGRRVDPSTGTVMADARGSRKGSLLDDSQVVDLASLQDDALLAHEGSYEYTHLSAIGNDKVSHHRNPNDRVISHDFAETGKKTDDRILHQLNHEDHEDESYVDDLLLSGLTEPQKDAQQAEVDKPYFILEDEPMDYTSAVDKFSHDLTSFGPQSHLDAQVPSVNAHSKRRGEL